MRAFSPTPVLISCIGCSARTVQLLHQSPYSSFSIQSPRFEELSRSQLELKKRSSVFGRIDVFSVLKYLVVSLGGCVELDWVLLSPELSKVCNVSCFVTYSSFSIRTYLVPPGKVLIQFNFFGPFHTWGFIVAHWTYSPQR